MNKFSTHILGQNELHSKCLEVLIDLDEVILKKWETEPHGLLSGSGGASLYLYYRFRQSLNDKYITHALAILDKEIQNANELGIEDYLSIGSSSSSSFWLINEFVKGAILDKTELEDAENWIKLSIKSTTITEYSINQHDLFYGFIGKAILALEINQEFTEHFVKTVVSHLISNIQIDINGAFWYTPEHIFRGTDCQKAINLGIPHGMLGILLFLFRCERVYGLTHNQTEIVNDVVKWIIAKLNIENNALKYSYSNSPSGSGKLGWCYGDLAIAYTLLLHAKQFRNNTSMEKAYEIIGKSSSLSLQNTGVSYFNQYDIFDICLCHGTSSICYMYKKLFSLTRDPNVEKKAHFWLNITLDSLGKYLRNIDELTNLRHQRINTTLSFLNGLSGVGLVLLSFLNEKNTNWDKLLLLHSDLDTNEFLI